MSLSKLFQVSFRSVLGQCCATDVILPVTDLSALRSSCHSWSVDLGSRQPGPTENCVTQNVTSLPGKIREWKNMSLKVICMTSSVTSSWDLTRESRSIGHLTSVWHKLQRSVSFVCNLIDSFMTKQ